MDRDDLAGWLRLTLTRGVGNGTARRLLAAFGPPAAIFGQTFTALRAVASEAQARALTSVPDGWTMAVEAASKWLDEAGDGGAARAVVALGDDGYPAALLDTDDPPLLLYLLGHPTYVSNQAVTQTESANTAIKNVANPYARCLAIVGSRNPTPQGTDNALEFARALAAADLTIVSGLALGVDGAAHEGALQGALLRTAEPRRHPATIAVVGTGLDRVYPRCHRELAHRIAEHGVLISEYALGTPPLAAHFPKRNRIISGLSGGTLVVEAALASGSLITARMALEQNREVFAIPGSIHAPQSRGCHALIRQGAKLVESAQDVLEELRFADAAPPCALAASVVLAGDVSGIETEGEDEAMSVRCAVTQTSFEPDSPLLQALGFDPVGLDALVARTGIDAAMLQVALLELELDGCVVRLPGGRFQRRGLA